MIERIDSTTLHFEKSMFFIDLVKHGNQKLYIELTQTLNGKTNKIKLNPSVITDVFKVVSKYQKFINEPSKSGFQYLSDSDQMKLVDRYLKNVSIEDLCMQFDQSREVLEEILRNKGLEIVSNKPPKKRYYKKRSNPSPWQEEDDGQLRVLHLKGYSIAELARFFNSSQGAIKSRMKKLGLL